MWRAKKLKIDCEVVQDLYVLYKEGDISEKTKSGIEEHLKECDNCRIIYESEEGFDKTLLDAAMETPSNKVDEKLLLKLKLKRLKIGVSIGLIAILLIASSVGFITYFINYHNNYLYERKILERDIMYADGKIMELTFNINYVKEDKLETSLQEIFINENRIDGHYKSEKDIVENGKRQGTEEFNYLKENSMNVNTLESVIDDLNITGGLMFTNDINEREEKVFYSLHQNSNFPIDIGLDLADMVKYMQKKYESGKWDSKDEEAFTTLKKYLNNYNIILLNEDKKIKAVINDNHDPIIIRSINSFFKPSDVDIAGICKANKELGDFVTNYCKSNKIGLYK